METKTGGASPSPTRMPYIFAKSQRAADDRPYEVAVYFCVNFPFWVLNFQFAKRHAGRYLLFPETRNPKPET